MTNKANKISSCGGCLVMLLVFVILVLSMLDYCSGDDAIKKREQDEKAIASFLAEMNLALDKKAAGALDKDEFQCYAGKVGEVLDPAIRERKDAFKAGQITLQQFKREAEIIYQEKSEQIFFQCIKGGI
jgi:hypothetical protein